MIDREHRMKIAVPRLRMLAALALLVIAGFGAATSVSAQGANVGELYNLHIRANTGEGGTTFGAKFTVKTQDGVSLGACTLEGDASSPPWQYCAVDVPKGIVVVVWEDPGTLPAGYAPVENPLTFDTTYPTTTPHQIDVHFDNEPQSGNTGISQTSEAASDSTTTPSPGGDQNTNASTGQTSNVAIATPVDGTGSTDSGSSRSSESASSTSTSTASSGTTGTTPFTIRARSCANSKGGCWDEVGAHFTVTTEDGEALGACTLEASGGTDPASCSVPVPVGIVVVVTEDVSTITPGFAPESNPIPFDTGVEPAADCGYCHWGPSFVNGPKAENTSAAGATNTEELVIWAGPNDVGAQFTVSTEDGEYVGECTLEGPVTGKSYCRIPVPVGIVVVVTEDVSTIAPGLAPESNPIRFDTGVEPYTQCAPCHWGPDFRNGPKSTSTGTTSSSGTPSSSSTSSPAKTWNASVQVRLCESAQGSGGLLTCHGEAGVTVNIYLASGELMGSCATGEPVQFPGGDMISTCSVDGMPFNADFVAKQDPSTVPAGYEPDTSELTLHVSDVYPGGGDQATFTFTNIRTGGSSGTSGSSSTAESATLLMTFRGCPDGFDPATGDFSADCTIPLDAPDASVISWGGDGQGGMNITALDRQDNGAYIYNGGPNTMNVQLSGLAPVVRNAYQVVGSDGANGDSYSVQLANGETREIYVFYYNE